jgi:uncharacterized membrane protein
MTWQGVQAESDMSNIKDVSAISEKAIEAIETGLPDDLRREIEKVPEEKRHRLIQQVAKITATAIHYQGPIPPAELIAGWQDLVPDAADRFLKMTEADLFSIHEDRKDRRRRDDRFRIIGLLAGAVIILGMIIGAIIAVDKGHPWIAALFLSAGAVAIVTAFLRLIGDLNHKQTTTPDAKPVAIENKPGLRQKKRR